MDLNTLAPFLAGPGAAVLVLLVVLLAVWKLAVNYVIPLVEKVVERHMAQIDALIESQRAVVASHEADRVVWSEGLKSMETALMSLAEDVTDIRQRVDAVVLTVLKDKASGEETTA